MTRLSFLLLSAAGFATPLAADEEVRQLDAHEHGTGQLDIAIEGNVVAIELHAPGADIVGFEHPAESDEDRAAIDAALATLANPAEIFTMPETAGCTLVEAEAELEDGHDDDDDDGDHHDEHGEDDHGDDEHGHAEHDDEHHDDDEDHGEDDDHAEHGHDDDGHDDEHDAHGHDDDDHAVHDEQDDHAHEANHTEFHVEYQLTCDDPGALSAADITYFATFPNAGRLQVQLVTEDGAAAAELTREAPTLDLHIH